MYDEDRIDTRKNFSRIFIEPPDEANTSCEESDDDVPVNIFSSNCEIVLRNGKRLGSEKLNCEKTSIPIDPDCDNEKLPTKRKRMPKANSDNNSVKDRPKPKRVKPNNDDKRMPKANSDNKSVKDRPKRKRVKPNNDDKSENSVQECCDAEPAKIKGKQ